uniref:Glycosyl transferase 64 domain-containing protein n=1 Tax=Chaetoceros debilis TaxID=122233 RepID=A0A7S3V5H3_9STRA|mmetsp:Transcript_14843/g.21511  ORF Transcript_14843/g.21511 Transcript_14843/m.21511 type:complete len:444 (+) Transcript_14843:198-1529(+)
MTRTNNRGLSLSILSQRARNKNKRWESINVPRLVMYLVLSIVGLMLMMIGRAISELSNADRPITREEIQSARISLSNAMNDHKLRPLRDIDRNKYTVRINTWRRNDLLMATVKHVMTCPNVAQIQIVWCDKENDVPNELMSLTSPNGNSGSAGIVIEKHDINSLNERYRILHDDVPTYGILSQDDDVVRPCLAMDIGFYRWTDHPDRMVGYDTRVHMIDQDTNVWSYGYLSSTQKRNEYSLVLPRFCFLHRDYMDSYIEHAPKRIYQTVDKEFNCEDIALSFYVSALTGGKVPLLADKWAMNSMVKTNSGSGGISNSYGHKEKRDACINNFATLLGLKDAYAVLRQGRGANEGAQEKEFGILMASPIKSAAGGKYLAGADVNGTKALEVKSDTVENRKRLYEQVEEHYHDVQATTNHLRGHMALLGLIEDTEKWKERWQHKEK